MSFEFECFANLLQILEKHNLKWKKNKFENNKFNKKNKFEIF